MTELLTESFCERCGTRYTFESAAPRRSRIGRVRVLSKGLRNFVLSDETTLSEAMADARSEEELAATALQLDAFHKAFNFCMSCRQYTCGTCWNTADGRCLTCAPLPGQELADELPEPPAVTLAAPEGPSSPDAAEVWPEFDLAAAPHSSAPGPDLVAHANGAAWGHEETDAEFEPVVATEPTAAAEAADSLPAGPGHEPVRPLGLEPGQSIEDAIAAYEARMASAIPAEPETFAPVDVAPEGEAPVVVPVAEASDPIAEASVADAAAAALAEAAVEPEPATLDAASSAIDAASDRPGREPDAAPDAASGPDAADTAATAPVIRDDVVPQPSWPSPAATAPAAASSSPSPAAASPATAPEVAPQPAPWLTVAPDVPLPDAVAARSEPPAPPQWPAQAAWMARPASGRTGAPATLAGRPLLPADASGLWAASNLEVAQAPASAGPQPCVSCGLSLSANARFCRRCGARQG
jgi:hypothetical protein